MVTQRKMRQRNLWKKRVVASKLSKVKKILATSKSCLVRLQASSVKLQASSSKRLRYSDTPLSNYGSLKPYKSLGKREFDKLERSEFLFYSQDLARKLTSSEILPSRLPSKLLKAVQLTPNQKMLNNQASSSTLPHGKHAARKSGLALVNLSLINQLKSGFTSTSPVPPLAYMPWNTYLNLRRSQRRAGTLLSIPGTFIGAAIGGTYFASIEFEADPTKTVMGA